MIHVGGYHDTCVGYHDTCAGYHEYCGGVQYRGYSNNKRFPPMVLNTAYGTHDIPHVHHNIPHGTEHPHGTLDIPHGTEHPHSTQDIPTLIMILPWYS